MIEIKINLQINTVDQNAFVSSKSSRQGSVSINRKLFTSKILRNDSDSQTFVIIVEHDICRSTKIDVRNQEFDIDELTSEKAVCTPWKFVKYEEIVQHLRAKTKIFEEPVQRNANVDRFN